MMKPAIVAMAGLIAAACPPQPPVLEAGANVCALIFGEDDGARAAAIKGLEAAGWQTVTEPSPKCQPNVFTTVVALPVEDGMGSTLAHSVTLSSWAGGVTLTPLAVNAVFSGQQEAIDSAVSNTISGLDQLRSGKDAVSGN